MFLFKEIHALQVFLREKEENQQQIGFIPTMGSLHAGHLSLVESCKKNGQLAVVSIFINPTQFNQQSDFDLYPRELEKDMEQLFDAGCDVLFHPDVAEIYPNGFANETFDFGLITNSLEGFYRPGHFNGVITVVRKLMDIVNPHSLYLGQKDFQQCAVIRHVLNVYGYRSKLHIIPTSREKSGLAMSSRNARLNEQELKEATVLYKALNDIKNNLHKVEAVKLEDLAKMEIAQKLQPEYVALVDYDTLEPLAGHDNHKKKVALVAAWCGKVRLIDNIIID